jgi:hypothetical protein
MFGGRANIEYAISSYFSKHDATVPFCVPNSGELPDVSRTHTTCQAIGSNNRK